MLLVFLQIPHHQDFSPGEGAFRPQPPLYLVLSSHCNAALEMGRLFADNRYNKQQPSLRPLANGRTTYTTQGPYWDLYYENSAGCLVKDKCLEAIRCCSDYRAPPEVAGSSAALLTPPVASEASVASAAMAASSASAASMAAVE